MPFAHMRMITSVVLMINFGVTAAIDQDSLFDQAHNACAAGDLVQANQLWQQAASTSTRACFNAGLYALGHDQPALARAYFKRAIADSDIGVRLAAFGYIRQLESQSVLQTVCHWLGLLPMLLWAIIALFLVLLLWRIHRGTAQRRLWQITMIFGIVGCFYAYRQSNVVPSVVLHESALFAGPDSNFTPVAQLPVGQTIMVLEQRDGWARVKTRNASGWICSDCVLC